MENKIVYITTMDRRYAAMNKACHLLQEEGRLSDYSIAVKVERTSEWNTSWERKIGGARLVMIRLMGNFTRSAFFEALTTYLKTHHIPYHLDAAEGVTQETGKGISPQDVAELKKYSFYGGIENYKNLWLYAAHLTDSSVPKPDAPSPFCWAGLYHPGMKDHYMTDLSRYRKEYCIEGKPTLGFLFYRDEWIWEDLTYQDKFIGEAERQGYNVISVFSNQLPDRSVGIPPLDEVFRAYFMDAGEPVIDVLVSTMKFSLTANKTVSMEDLKRLDVPILAAYTLLESEREWLGDPKGMNSVETSISISMPELDGVIHGLPVAGRKKLPDGGIVYEPIEDRIRAMVAKAGKWARLRHIRNQDKKVAIIFHNYPAKNSNIGSASGLDTMESVIRLMKRMKESGYTIHEVPQDAEELVHTMTSHATNDISMMTEAQARECQKLPAKDYISYFEGLGDEAKRSMEEEWGKAPGSVMLSEEGNILVPGRMDGNIFLTVQPSRQYGMDPAKAYHDPHISPTHQYVAFYYWLREVWRADAVIHVGTHGNLEWLPGKGNGLDQNSFPAIALGDLPNIYPYHMTITGEGMIAKRRSSGCLIGYLPAPLDEAGVYDELEELDKTIEEYSRLKDGAEGKSSELHSMIRKLAEKAQLDKDVAFDASQPFDEYVSALHNYIEELKDGEVHVGLHVLGEPPEGEILVGTLLQMLRLSHDDRPSLMDLWAEKYEIDADYAMDHAGEMCEALHMTYGEALDLIKKETRAFIQRIAEGGYSEEAVQAAVRALPPDGEHGSWKEKLIGLGLYVVHDLYPRLMATQDEMTNTLHALSGGYVPSGPSGSPSAGGAGLLPSGRNFYGLDPRTLPSKAGWILGCHLGDQLIEKYIAHHGRYPESVGMVLWSGPNMRSSGQDIAEFLYLLGVRPVWQKGTLQVSGLTVIPLHELKRPRIDVTARISGLFRDTLLKTTELMDRAVLMVSRLEEKGEDNFIRKHILQDSALLEGEGSDPDGAWRNAAFRIFGAAPGTYGAGVNTVLDAKNWQNEDDLAKVYLRWGAHAFGGKTAGEFKPELFKKRLAAMDVTVKNEDNRETNILSSDDYNAFHGGMIAAVKSFGGKSPDSYIGDSSNKGRIGTRTVQEEMRRVFRTESANPKYIEGLMKHGYKGASDLANRVSISFQWDATSGVMDDWMYKTYAEKYAFDPKVQAWMKKVNPWALQSITETLLEADQRKMWKADDETRERLQELYLSVEGEMEDDGDDSE